MTAESTVFFGPWRFTKSDGKLISDDEQHRLPPRLNVLLSLLLESAGQVVPRDVIIDTIWGDKVVNEDALARAIAELRNLLGDSSKSPTFIETIPRRGYRFICVVHHGGALTDETIVEQDSQELGEVDTSQALYSSSDGSPSDDTLSKKEDERERQRRWLGKRLFAVVVLMIVLVLTSSLLVLTGTWSPQDGFIGFREPSGDNVEKTQGTEIAESLTGAEPDLFDESQSLMAQLINAKRITTDPEIEVHPELSLNGEFLTYSTLNTGEKQGQFYAVTVQDTRTGQKTIVTRPESHLVSAMVSPDAQSLLAVALKPSGVGNQRSCNIMLFDVTTLVSQKLTECDLPDRSAILEWHPDGDRFLFVKQAENTEGTVVWEYDLLAQRQTALTDLSLQYDPLMYDSRPRYSPDGKSIAFLRGTSSVRNLYVQSLSDNKAKPTPVAITNSNSVKVSFDWMPSGQALIFDSNILGDKQILMAALPALNNTTQNKGEPSLTSSITNVGGKDGQFPMVNNNGTVAAYQEARYQANLWQFELNDEAQEPRPIVESLKYDNFPVFDPTNTSRMLYVSNRSGFAAIYQLDTTTQVSQELLRVPNTHLIAPVFTPNGERLLISAITANDFYCYEFEFSTRSLITLPAEQVSLCAYGPGSNDAGLPPILALDKTKDGQMSLVHINRESSDKQTLMAGPIDNFVVATTTQEIVFTKRLQRGLFASKIATVNNDDGMFDIESSRTLLSDLPTRFSHSWSISGTHLYYVNAKQGNSMWRKDLTGQNTEQQVSNGVNVGIGRVIAVSPDETSLVVSLKGSESGNIFIYDGR